MNPLHMKRWELEAQGVSQRGRLSGVEINLGGLETTNEMDQLDCDSSCQNHTARWWDCDRAAPLIEVLLKELRRRAFRSEVKGLAKELGVKTQMRGRIWTEGAGAWACTYVFERAIKPDREAGPAHCQANRGAATEPIKDYYIDDLLMASVQWITEVCGCRGRSWAGRSALGAE